MSKEEEYIKLNGEVVKRYTQGDGKNVRYKNFANRFCSGEKTGDL